MRLLGRSRRYSPLNRALGIRRLPDDLLGLAFLASLVLHATLVVSLVRLTDALPDRPGGEDVPAVLMDLAAETAAGPPMPVPAAVVPTERSAPAVSALMQAKTSVPAVDLGRRAATPAARMHAPAAAWSDPVAEPAAQPTPSPVAAPGPPRGEPRVVSVVSSSVGGPDVTVPPALEIDTALDAGWPEPPTVTATIPPTARPAKTLTSVPRIPDGAQHAAAPPTQEPLRTAALEQRESPVIAVPAPGPEVEARKPIVPVAVAAGVSAQARSALGLNRDRALVRLDGPRTSVADQPAQTVSGTILGGLPERLVIYINGVPAEVTSTGRTFEIAALLQPGANELRAVVTSLGGLEAEDTITVQYVPRPSSSGIVLSSPPDGLTVGPEDPPVVVVEGEVDDKSLTSAWIVANERRIPVMVSAGKFRHTILLPDPLVHLRAEAASGDITRRSGTVTVRTTRGRTSSGVLVVQWPAGTDGSSVEVSATWRAQAERLDVPVQTMRLPAVGESTPGAPSAMFYLRGLKPGVYTLIVRYRGAAPLLDVRPTLYLPDKDHLALRALRPVSLPGAGRRVVAKVLMPQAVLWNQEDWFSGTSESVDTVTKFRVPEGISWVERKADLQ